MSWWKSASQDSTNARGGTAAAISVDKGVEKEQEENPVPAFVRYHYQSIKRDQASSDTSEPETSTKRAKGTDQADERLEQHESEVAALTEKVQKFHQDALRDDEDYSQLRDDNDSYSFKIQASNEKLLEMTEKHKQSEALVSNLRADISRQSDEIQQLQREQRTARVKELEHTELDEAERTIRGLRSHNSGMSYQIQRLKSKLNGAEARRSRETAELGQSNRQLEKNLLEMTKKHEESQALVSDLREMNSIQKGEIDYCISEVASARDSYADLKRTKHEEAFAIITSLRALNATQSDQIEQLENDLQVAETKHKQLKQSKDKLKGSLESERLSGTKRAFRQRRAYRRLKHEANSVRKELKIVTAKRNQLNARLSETETQLFETEIQLAETEDELREHEEENGPEDCLVVICVDISDINGLALDQIKHTYNTILLFLQARWGDRARVAVIVHGCEGNVNVTHEAQRIGHNTWDLVANEASGGDNDYRFCISEARDIMARDTGSASKKVIVMIGDWADMSFGEESLQEAARYLLSNRIPAYSIVVRDNGSLDDVDMSSSVHAILADMIGGGTLDHKSYYSALEEVLGRE